MIESLNYLRFPLFMSYSIYGSCDLLHQFAKVYRSSLNLLTASFFSVAEALACASLAAKKNALPELMNYLLLKSLL